MVTYVKKRDPNNVAAKDVRIDDDAMRVSVGDPDKNEVKTSGVKIRGTGAARRGVMARGPLC